MQATNPSSLTATRSGYHCINYHNFPIYCLQSLEIMEGLNYNFDQTTLVTCVTLHSSGAHFCCSTVGSSCLNRSTMHDRERRKDIHRISTHNMGFCYRLPHLQLGYRCAYLHSPVEFLARRTNTKNSIHLRAHASSRLVATTASNANGRQPGTDIIHAEPAPRTSALQISQLANLRCYLPWLLS